MGKKKILMVEDEATVRGLLKDLMQMHGYEFIEAEDGKKGLDEARKHKPDMILLDVNMPKMNGFEVLEQLKKDKKTQNIPVIMLTTRDTHDDMAHGMELYAEKYIPKPFDTAMLMLEINKSFQSMGR
jgi:DNA-binding response OmpR family regulator